MKWIFFALSLLGLFVANNALFWMPGNYDWLIFTFAGIGILFAAIFALLSGKRFAKEQTGWKALVVTPPVVIWVFVIFLFCCGSLLKFLAYWQRG